MKSITSNVIPFRVSDRHVIPCNNFIITNSCDRKEAKRKIEEATRFADNLDVKMIQVLAHNFTKEELIHIRTFYWDTTWHTAIEEALTKVDPTWEG